MPSARTETLTVSSSEAGTRLDKFLAGRLPDLSRSHLQKIIEDGAVLVDSMERRGSYRVREGDQITITVPPATPVELIPEEIPLSIIYEDDDVIVLNKPAHLVVHPAPGHPAGTLVNAILAHCPDLSINGSIRPGIVQRLDRDTSGLMVIAKSDRGKISLVEQLTERRVLKEYLALVIPKLGRLIKLVHFSDNDGTQAYHHAPGTGKIDFPAVVRSLKRAGFDGTIVVDISGVPDIVAEAVKARDYFERLIREAGA